MRLWLAIKCFLLILFTGRLPEDAKALLPAERPKGLPPQEAEIVDAELARTQPLDPALSDTFPTAKKVPLGEPKPKKADDASRGAVQLLAILQREGRLLDFLQEEIDAYSDAQIGAAVRDIHRGCKKALAEHAPLEPVLDGKENGPVRVDAGFDPSRIRLVGNVVGDPPFQGVLRHHGWRTAKVLLPELVGASDPSVVAPAEVEL